MKPQHGFDKVEVEVDKTISTQRARLRTVDLGWRWIAVRQWNLLPDIVRQCGNKQFQISGEETHHM